MWNYNVRPIVHTFVILWFVKFYLCKLHKILLLLLWDSLWNEPSIAPETFYISHILRGPFIPKLGNSPPHVRSCYGRINVAYRDLDLVFPCGNTVKWMENIILLNPEEVWLVPPSWPVHYHTLVSRGLQVWCRPPRDPVIDLYVL
jgi:hypothetical protein